MLETMNARTIVAGATLVVACAVEAPAAESAAAAPAAVAALPKKAAPAKPILDKGMTAEQVRQAIGAPLAIKPMEAPAGSKAEMWIYRRVAGETTRPAAVTMKSQPTFVGNEYENPVMDRPVMDYQLERVTTYQVTALLMVDGKLELARQWKESQRSYQK